MKTNVTYLSKKFQVNPTKHAVNCVLRWEFDMTKLPNYDALLELPYFIEFVTNLVNDGVCTFGEDENRLVFTERGFSKCAPTDEFNEQVGRNLALTRAQKLAFQNAYMLYNTIYELVYKSFAYDLEQKMTANLTSSFRCANHEHEITNHEPVVYEK